MTGTVSMALIVDAPKTSAGADSTALAAGASITSAAAYSRSFKLATDTPSVHMKTDLIAFVDDPMVLQGLSR